ncbi:MAG: dehydrogenase [Cyanobacteriota bacterium]|nr:dehydrogenase [Cyanobacteriota bacterium]
MIQSPRPASPLQLLATGLGALLVLAPLLGQPAAAQDQEEQQLARSSQAITGPRSRLPKDWQGLRPVAPGTEILVMPGHADSQGFGGGASGAAVALDGARPMDPSMSDELFWNLLTVEAVVRRGQARGLSIRSYDPLVRRIASGSDPRTTWSVGKAHVQNGGYALEIHYDAHGSAGVGSGLIPPISQTPSQIDESLAAEFGAFPRWFRDGLGAPKRGIAILEIGKLEGQLEASLRNPSSRDQTLEAIADRVVSALERGVNSALPPLSPPPDVVGSVPAGSNPRASSGAE